MKVKLEVPFYSQKEIVTNGESDGSCGIVCVKMILDFAEKDNDIQSLLKEGYVVGGKKEEGWNHEALIRVLRNHEVLAFGQEFISHDVDFDSNNGTENIEQTKKFFDLGIEKIKGSIDYGYPVISSVKPGFGENGNSHLILVIGYDEENFYLNDPQLNSDQEVPLVVSIERFKEYWKGLTIFVEF